MKRSVKEGKLVVDAQLLRDVVNQIPDVFVLKDRFGDFILCNNVVAELYGSTPEEMIGKQDKDFGVPEEISEGMRQNVLNIMDKGETEIVYEDSVDAKTGELRHFKSIKKPIKDEDGENQIIVIAQDITDVIESQKKIKENEARLKAVLDVIHEGVWDWHIPSNQVLHNKVWYEVLGLDVNHTLCSPLSEFEKHLHPDDIDDVKTALKQLLSGKNERYASEHRMVKQDGSIIYVRDRGEIVERDKDGHPIRVIGSFKNITKEKEAESLLKEQAEELKRLARTDILTGLHNRLLMEEALQYQLDLLERTHKPFAIILIDLDLFKKVNDNFGHEVGDHVLVEAANIFKQATRKTDLVGRWGGEEFLIICPDTDTDGTQVLAQNICDNLSSHRFADIQQLTCSIGATITHKGELRRTLLKRADDALYTAKQNGRNQIRLL